MANTNTEWSEEILRDSWMIVNASRIDAMDDCEELILQRVEERLDERLLEAPKE